MKPPCSVTTPDAPLSVAVPILNVWKSGLGLRDRTGTSVLPIFACQGTWKTEKETHSSSLCYPLSLSPTISAHDIPSQPPSLSILRPNCPSRRPIPLPLLISLLNHSPSFSTRWLRRLIHSFNSLLHLHLVTSCKSVVPITDLIHSFQPVEETISRLYRSTSTR